MATVEEVNLQKDIRRLFAKRPLDSTRLEIQCIRGRIYLSGTITAQKEEMGVIVKNELLDIVNIVVKLPGVKQVFNECKMVEPEKPKKPEEGHGHGGAPPGH